MHLHRLCVMAVILAAPGWCAAAAFFLDARRDGDAIEIVAIADIRSDPLHAWQVITAYERYAEFIPDVEASRVIRRDGAALVIELTGATRVMWWEEPLAVRLAVTETAHWRVRSQLISGTLADLRGEYTLAEAPGGVRLTYTGRIVPDRRQRGFLDRFFVRLNVSRQFRALVAEIARPVPPPPGAAAE